MKLTEKQEQIYLGKVCPYCNSITKLVSEETIFGKNYDTNKKYVCCGNYPRCNSYVGTDSHYVAKGRLAGQNLRAEKKRLINAIYRITHNKYDSKENIYRKIAEYLGIPRNYVSPDLMNIDNCSQATTFCLSMLSEHLEKRKHGAIS